MLHCCVFSNQGLAVACQLKKKLKNAPWQTHDGLRVADCSIYAPARICAKSDGLAECAIMPFTDAAGLVKKLHPASKGFIFIGATGIAVRLMAPMLIHKSVDPPVVCIDSSGQFAISLLSGHLGGANSLARHLARFIGAIPVITTNSDNLPSFLPALDLFLRKYAIKVLDWDNLPTAQALINEGQSLPLHDPLHCLPSQSFLTRMSQENFLACSSPGTPGLHIHWKKRSKSDGVIRLAPLLHIGIGCRKNTTFESLQEGFSRLQEVCALELEAVASLATVKEKESQIQPLAQLLNIPLFSWSAVELAGVRTPNPSAACGKRFATQPFSVCEAAAILAARSHLCNPAGSARLFQDKISFQHEMTFAIASAWTGEFL